MDERRLLASRQMLNGWGLRDVRCEEEHVGGRGEGGGDEVEKVREDGRRWRKDGMKQY